MLPGGAPDRWAWPANEGVRSSLAELRRLPGGNGRGFPNFSAASQIASLFS